MTTTKVKPFVLTLWTVHNARSISALLSIKPEDYTDAPKPVQEQVAAMARLFDTDSDTFQMIISANGTCDTFVTSSYHNNHLGSPLALYCGNYIIQVAEEAGWNAASAMSSPIIVNKLFEDEVALSMAQM